MTTIPDDVETACRECGVPSEERTCRRCGVSAQLVDCGHYAQPRPISGAAGETLCDACWVLAQSTTTTLTRATECDTEDERS
jgi:predicted RNA-binding protein with PUA domain